MSNTHRYLIEYNYTLEYDETQYTLCLLKRLVLSPNVTIFRGEERTYVFVSFESSVSQIDICNLFTMKDNGIEKITAFKNDNVFDDTMFDVEKAIKESRR